MFRLLGEERAQKLDAPTRDLGPLFRQLFELFEGALDLSPFVRNVGIGRRGLKNVEDDGGRGRDRVKRQRPQVLIVGFAPARDFLDN